MAVTATVTPGKVFGDSDVITKETLNQLGQPTITIDGSVGSLALADGSVTGPKIAGDAGIALTQLEPIARGKIVVGNASADGAIVDASDTGKILVGDGTDLNSVAVTGDVELASTGAVTIATGAVEAGMLDSGIVVTDGGLEKVVAGLQIKDDGIDPLTKITGHADRIGQLISYDDSGDPEYVAKGTAGQVLRGNEDDAPSFGSVFAYNETGGATLDSASGTRVQFAHSLGAVPSLVRAVLVCQAGGDDGSNSLGFVEDDELDVHSILNEVDDWYGVHSVVADDENVTVTIISTSVLYVAGKNVNNVGYLTRTKWKIKVYAAP